MSIPFARARLSMAIALAAAVAGSIAALHYHHLGLTLSHYDARGHIVVARRILDSITPGWQQIGAVWLPLPHLLNALPVQIDVFYRTGASAVALSIVSFAAATGAVAWIVLDLTSSSMAAIAAAAVFGLNPNVLYLQSTPMTEPLLLGLTIVAVARLLYWCRADAAASRSASSTVVGWLLALACMTRYEAWPVTAAALAGAAWARRRDGATWSEAVRAVSVHARYPAIALAGFALFSRVVVGQWFVSGDFFVPENKALGLPALAAREIGWGVETLSSPALVWIATTGVAALLVVGLLDRSRARAIIALSLATTAVIPWIAFYKGHPYRIRYMVPLIAIEAIGCGIAAGLVRRARVPASLGVLALALYTLRPLDASAPMAMEAQWDRPNTPVRDEVTACLGAPRPGEKIMASMGSLGHYMQEASRAGYQLRDFLHEGNGDIWLAALDGPRPFAQWVMIEEKAQGGDMLAKIAREHPHFLDGYSRICEGAGLALYARDQNRKLTVSR